MKVVILAGGMQSAISSEREGIPKPMIDIGGKPLLWHIMKHFSEYNLNEFIICGGYRVDMIKEYFMDFYIYQSDNKGTQRENGRLESYSGRYWLICNYRTKGKSNTTVYRRRKFYSHLWRLFE